MAKHNEAAGADSAAAAGDLTITGRTETVVDTVTVVEDRTEEPADVVRVEYQSEDIDLGHGTILTSYGEPVGGLPEAAPSEAE